MLTDIIESSLYEHCGVNEEQFPCMGKCCLKSDVMFMVSYAKACPYCRISTSLPEREIEDDYDLRMRLA